jgi:enoyl-CoA hydratase/carnithine racemase
MSRTAFATRAKLWQGFAEVAKPIVVSSHKGSPIMQFDFKHLTLEVDGKVARVTLNRPALLNAMHHEAVLELEAAAKIVDEDSDIRIVALTGAGRAFSTGIDLKDLAAGKIDMAYHEPWERALRRFETMEKIVLCAIHGYALGGGLQLALACDIRAGTASARLGLPAVNEGLIPGLATFRLARYIGIGRAKQMILSGDSITGEQALNIGLIDHSVSEQRMAQELEQLIGKYLQSNNEGCRFSKGMLVECFDLDFDRFRGRYMDLQSKAMNSGDFHEAMAAYREKRTPGWK